MSIYETKSIITLSIQTADGSLEDGHCCDILEFDISGPAKNFPIETRGLYHQDPWISNNNYSAFEHKSGKYSILMDERHGWRVTSYMDLYPKDSRFFNKI